MKRQRARVILTAAACLCLVMVLAALRLSGFPDGRVTLTLEEYGEYSRFAAIGELQRLIEREFYSAPPSEGDMIAAAAKGMVQSLNDPYAKYYTAKEYEAYLSDINGDYFGLGMRLVKREGKGAGVIEVYPGSPAETAGILAGDVITHIDGEKTADLELDRILALIQEGQREGVSLTISRDGDTITVSAAGGSVRARQVRHRLLNEYTGYIAVSMFTGNCADEFMLALEELRSRGMRSLVIDLRDNPGGSLDMVVRMADALLGKGMRIVSVGKAAGEEETVYEASGEAIGVPLAVLVNGSSASASEILAAAVQENGVGVVVGSKTYGKGIVQTTMYVEGLGGWLKLTTDSYFTPNGNDIHGAGVTPDILIEPEERYSSAPAPSIPQEEDAELRAALDYVRSRD